MTNRAYKFRIYPNAEQQVLFAKTFGCVRFIYNIWMCECCGEVLNRDHNAAINILNTGLKQID